MEKADIGLVGLAVMGENLIPNMESHGHTVAVFNRTIDKVDEFVAGRAMLMVKAGKPVDGAQESSRRVVAQAALNGIRIPAHATALSFYDGFRAGWLPANLLQAQRDCFGTHQHERLDQPRGQFFHTNWMGRGGDTASSAYIV